MKKEFVDAIKERIKKIKYILEDLSKILGVALGKQEPWINILNKLNQDFANTLADLKNFNDLKRLDGLFNSAQALSDVLQKQEQEVEEYIKGIYASTETIDEKQKIARKFRDKETLAKERVIVVIEHSKSLVGHLKGIKTTINFSPLNKKNFPTID